MKFNLELVYDPDIKNILFVQRIKEPYKGLLNLVGGKKETGETPLQGAYRELFEETGISQQDIELMPLMAVDYHIDDVQIEIFFGRLKNPVQLITELNPLHWISVDTDFTDDHKFSGDGNINHIIKEAQYYLDKL